MFDVFPCPPLAVTLALLAGRFLEAGEGVLQRLHFRQREQVSER
jgi:hypothetical protein